ncbi:hypothetical protein GOP47_0017447 [Adiantum capillus-veneris]|uniref:2'-phosphotransferase n=1 Tax=Adiantum capillus-veneris TaxID=13818 RepID=A0A9D4UFE1_ADICA|nr:hypothetical protein GOP47_0017447 [Adiantum capillus-veneris]
MYIQTTKPSQANLSSSVHGKPIDSELRSLWQYARCLSRRSSVYASEQYASITKFCILSQNAHFLSRMAPPKSFPKVGLTPKGSFGGCNQPGSVTQSGVNYNSGSAVASLSSDSVKLSLQDEDFPPLGKEDTSSGAKVVNNSQKTMIRGSPPRIQTQDVPHSSSRPWNSASSSRQIHRGADEDDDWFPGADAEDLAPRNSSRSKKKAFIRKKPTDVGAGERASSSQDRIYFLGRLLTSILRHRAVDMNLEVRSDGYIVVNDLLKLPIKTRTGIPLSVYTVDDILKAVERDNKQRFTLVTEKGVLLIRANQGHSIKTIESEKLLKPILSSEEISVCVHGTLMSNLNSILKTGLKKMGRNHVHFASGLPREDGVISGMRHTSEVLIYLDAKKALQDGMKLYLSDNGVILTEGFDGVVPPEYFAKIARWKNGKITPLPLNVKSESA